MKYTEIINKDKIKALITKERLAQFGIGIFTAALFSVSCYYAWYCGNQAYMENLEASNAVNVETTEIVEEVVENADAVVEQVEEEKAKAEEEAAAAAAVEYNNYGNYSSGYSSYNTPSSGLTMQSGVNYYGDRKETYYSSNVLYHYRTGEWTVDDEGFYRTSDGYYVVAASDMAQGTTFQGSKGTCIVLDSGCAGGVTDYYVAW